MNFEAMLFDLDDTVYPATSGVWEAIGVRMDTYMTDTLGFAAGEVHELRKSLFAQYGTTLRGLKTVYGIDEVAFLDFVHDIPLDQYIRRDEGLIETLAAYDDRKLIFTNANRAHAQRVLNLLDIDDQFERIIDILDISPYCKPFEEAFQMAIRLAGIGNPADCVVIDDSARNLETASRLGFMTIQVGCSTRSPFADACVPALIDLPSVIPVPINTERNVN